MKKKVTRTGKDSLIIAFTDEDAEIYGFKDGDVIEIGEPKKV